MKRIAIGALLLTVLAGHSAADVWMLRPYGEAQTINVCLPDATDPTDYEAGAAFVAGDVVVQKDEGVPANIGTLPTDEGDCYSFPLTATEMQAARVQVTLIDQTVTKDWIDTAVYIDTYGADNALHDQLGWSVTCEDQGGRTCQEVMSIVLAEAAGVCNYTPGTSTWVCSDPENNETRLTIVYGTDSGDRTSSTLTPMTP